MGPSVSKFLLWQKSLMGLQQCSTKQQNQKVKKQWHSFPSAKQMVAKAAAGSELLEKWNACDVPKVGILQEEDNAVQKRGPLQVWTWETRSLQIWTGKMNTLMHLTTETDSNQANL